MMNKRKNRLMFATIWLVLALGSLVAGFEVAGWGALIISHIYFVDTV